MHPSKTYLYSGESAQESCDPEVQWLGRREAVIRAYNLHPRADLCESDLANLVQSILAPQPVIIHRVSPTAPRVFGGAQAKPDIRYVFYSWTKEVGILRSGRYMRFDLFSGQVLDEGSDHSEG